MSDLDTKSATNLAVAVTFTYGDTPTVHRYIRWDDEVEIDGETFEPAPELTVFDSGEQTGGSKDSPLIVQMRSSRQPFDKLLRPYSHAPIRCLIGECDPSDPDATWFEVWSGMLLNTTRNADGIKSLVKATIGGIKNGLKASLGVQANGRCVNVFGDHVCGAEVPEHEITIESIDGLTVVFSGYTPPRSTYFRFGELELGGLRLSIAKQVDDTTLTMMRKPPPEWVSETAIARPGCDKLYRIVEGVPEGDCAIWERTGRFTGYGAKMPNHNPIFENPS